LILRNGLDIKDPFLN